MPQYLARSVPLRISGPTCRPGAAAEGRTSTLPRPAASIRRMLLRVARLVSRPPRRYTSLQVSDFRTQANIRGSRLRNDRQTHHVSRLRAAFAPVSSDYGRTGSVKRGSGCLMLCTPVSVLHRAVMGSFTGFANHGTGDKSSSRCQCPRRCARFPAGPHRPRRPALRAAAGGESLS